jgi:hypothetical protein
MKTAIRSKFAALLAVACSLVLATSASALSLTPASFDATIDYKGAVFIPGNIDAGDVEDITGNEVIELYKANVGAPVVEEKDFAAYYTTVFTNTSLDPEDATITWDGPLYITGTPIYLLLKDGNSNPWWYLFDLSARNWDGKETISLTDFWVGKGAISHVSIFGGEQTTQVPDSGATIALIGLALTGFAIASRRRNA